jgi:regulator of protease activity HflC (stomatin/prohibitin superfamily)
MIGNFILMLATLLGLIIFLLTPHPFWALGAIIVLVTWFIFLWTVVPYKPAATRGRWAFGATFVLVATLLITAATFYLQSNPISLQLSKSSMSFIPFLEVKDYSTTIDPKTSAILLGILATLALTLTLFVVIGYFSSIYILALHEEEVSFWDAFKSFWFLIFDVKLGWLLVENGEIKELKSKGFVNKWLSRGKIIVKPGNAVVLEKGGRITGIHGPKTILTVKDETIRQVFDLRPQFVLHELDNVITADGIPLEIKFSAGYRITPAKTPDAPEVIKEGNFGVFPVEEATLRKAAFNGTPGGWKGFGENVCVGQLRDQIMAHRFDEIFEIQGGAQNISVRVNERQIKHIENAIMEAVNSFADANMGVTITFVDIGEITFPDDVKEAIQMRIKSQAEAEAIERIEINRNRARGNMVESILSSIAGHTNQQIGDVELRLATIFAYISRRALTDDVLGREYVKVLEKLATGEGTKIFNATPSQSVIEPADRITLPTPDISTSRTGNGNNH